MKTCCKCYKTKKIKNFPKRGDYPDRPASICKTCEKIRLAKYRKKNRKEIRRKWNQSYERYRAKIQNYHLVNKYGMTRIEYNERLKNQNYKCLGCKRHKKYFKKNLSVDHCHETGKIRGLLCVCCNRALGLIKDNVNTLKLLIKYLKGTK